MLVVGLQLAGTSRGRGTSGGYEQRSLNLCHIKGERQRGQTAAQADRSALRLAKLWPTEAGRQERDWDTTQGKVAGRRVTLNPTAGLLCRTAPPPQGWGLWPLECLAEDKLRGRVTGQTLPPQSVPRCQCPVSGCDQASCDKPIQVPHGKNQPGRSSRTPQSHNFPSGALLGKF